MLSFILSLILFIVILSLIVGIHEFGHFIFAKLSNTYVYEFSIGMGSKLFGKKRKNGETEFAVRAIPLGGYVMIAGEDVLDSEIPSDRQMCNKNFIQRFLILFAGPFNNFLFAFLILFISALIYGAVDMKPYINSVQLGSPAQIAGLESGDLILELDGEKIKNFDKALLKFQTSEGEEVNFKVKKKDNHIETYKIKPKKETDSDGNTVYRFGISTQSKKEYGFVNSINYAYKKTFSLFGTMLETFKYLFNGRIGIDQLSGPVGIYSIVDSQAKLGLEAILYLTAYLSINVGLINLFPFPAFDGGRIVFLIIEKIFKSPISKKVENYVNSIGFGLLLLLMLYVTLNDIIRLF